uniref:Amino acid permease/ SLC12A domain-containing protein n=1 Tax=Lotharella globosa TaxID=91324 RepID=A0A7S3ZD82_9EUKA
MATMGDEEHGMQQTRRRASIDEDDMKRIYGTWDGVFARDLCEIFGAVIFLRLGWVVGNAGIIQGLVIVIVSATVAMLTTFSMSAICTNGKLKSGGAYYMLSRVLGLKKGGAIGILYAVSQAFNVSLAVVGFVTTLVDLIDYKLTNHDIRLYGFMLTIVCMFVVRLGILWRTQMVMLLFIFVAVVAFIVGTFITTNPERGITGYDASTATENVLPDYVNADFFSVFGVYFPAAVGLMSGANRSGELKNPSHSLPTGTIWAIGVSTSIYALLITMLGCVALRTVEGHPGKGLREDDFIMVYITPVPALMYAGIFAATLSSALGAFVGSQRIFTALAKDDLLPFSAFLLRGAGWRMHLLVLLLACAGVSIENLNDIAKLNTMFYLLIYALLNYSVSALESSKSPGWRPTFKFYSWWSGLLGALVCVAIMFVIDWLFALVAGIMMVILYKILGKSKPNLVHGQADVATKELRAIRYLFSLRHLTDAATTYRPHFLLLWSGLCKGCSELDFLGCLDRGHGALWIGNIIHGRLRIKHSKKRSFLRDGFNLNHTLKTSSLLGTFAGPELDDASVTSATTEINSRRNSAEPKGGRRGSVEPPKPRRDSLEPPSVHVRGRSRAGSLESARPKRGATGLPRVPSADGLASQRRPTPIRDLTPEPRRRDSSNERNGGMEMKEMGGSGPWNQHNSYIIFRGNLSKVSGFSEQLVAQTFDEGANALMQTCGIGRLRPNVAVLPFPEGWSMMVRKKRSAYISVVEKALELHKGIMITANFPQAWDLSASSEDEKTELKLSSDSVAESYIDVWWLTDEGGLILLVAYLLHQHPKWKHCKVRLFTVTEHAQELTNEERAIIKLLGDLRIPWESNLQVLASNTKPSMENCSVWPSYAKTMDNKSKMDLDRWLRVSELLKDHSSRSKITFVTMPVPRGGRFGGRAEVFSTKIQAMKAPGMPTVFVHGSGNNVITIDMDG